MKHAIHGVHSAVATPVGPDGEPNLPLYAAHCRALLEEGCHGLAVLGTTGEANSWGLRQRMAIVEGAIDGGVPANVLLPGTAAPSVGDTVELTSHALQAGAKGVVLLPPYYYKGVPDDGLFRYFAEVIEGVGNGGLRIVLYHIPQVTQIPFSHDLIERLIGAFPGIVCGIKDSSGDLDNMRAMCDRFPDLGVLAGADPLMLPVLKMGGAGCITATSNLRADALRIVWDGWQDPAKAEAVEAAQDRINIWRDLSGKYVQIPTVKAMVARTRGDDSWAMPRPPLQPLTEAERADIWAEMEKLGG